MLSRQRDFAISYGKTMYSLVNKPRFNATHKAQVQSVEYLISLNAVGFRLYECHSNYPV